MIMMSQTYICIGNGNRLQQKGLDLSSDQILILDFTALFVHMLTYIQQKTDIILSVRDHVKPKVYKNKDQI